LQLFEEQYLGMLTIFILSKLEFGRHKKRGIWPSISE